MPKPKHASMRTSSIGMRRCNDSLICTTKTRYPSLYPNDGIRSHIMPTKTGIFGDFGDPSWDIGRNVFDVATKQRDC